MPEHPEHNHSENEPAEPRRPAAPSPPQQKPASRSGPSGRGPSEDAPLVRRKGTHAPPERLEEVAAVMERALELHDKALSDNTHRAYRQGWRDFKAFCAAWKRRALPARPDTIALYITTLAQQGYATSTIRQRVQAIAHYHRKAKARRQAAESGAPESGAPESGPVDTGPPEGANGRASSGAGASGERALADDAMAGPAKKEVLGDPYEPTRTEAVRNVLSGLARERSGRKDKAPPLLTEHIRRMIEALPGAGESPPHAPDAPEAKATWLRGVRDRALLLVGYAGALRRSELVSLRVEDVERRPEGVALYLERSKTDQEKKGAVVAIREGRGQLCPVAALWRWLSTAGIEEGPIFRGVRRNGRLRPGALTGRSVSRIVERAARAANLPRPEDYSGHSLRSGHITQATMNGMPKELVMKQSRHRSIEAFLEYVRSHDAMQTSSSAKLGLDQ